MNHSIRQVFTDKFAGTPTLVSAPGRVNLIGEHTDYNQGFVLPGAIDKKIYIAIAKNQTDTINVFANEFNEFLHFSPAAIPRADGWKNYILGVTHFIQQKCGCQLGGVDVVIDGDVPVGGGMSSSAALCSGYGFALNELFDLKLSRLDLAYIGQQTEHEFVGAKVGIMDQFASLHGKAGHLIRLDCRSMEYEYIPFNFPQYCIVMFNSMVKHSLAGSEYNVRRQQCEEGVRVLKEFYPQIESLRDISAEELASHQSSLDPVVYRRCKYVVEEKDRVLEACRVLQQGDIRSFGKLMFRTHEGLSEEYDVSCVELDFLVANARPLPAIVGSRMMGGGFGGCTINLVDKKAVQGVIETISNAYKEKFHILPESYIIQIEDGVKLETEG